MPDISNTEDILDVRDIIERFEELENARENACDGEDDAADAEKLKAFDESDEGEEYASLKTLLDDLKGGGGDEKWRGAWYPVTLIRDTYFEKYAEQLADDIGAIDSNATWPLNCIDWEQAACELKMDYSTVEYGGVTYWYR